MNLGIGLGVATSYLPIPAVALDPDAAIAALFGSGEVGAWYDPSDSSTVWQDAAGTTPATVGDPVGRIDDKSGNGNHATQSTSAARPVLQQSGGLYYLDFDGVDDWIGSAAFASAQAQPNSIGVGFKFDTYTVGGSNPFNFVFDGVNTAQRHVLNNTNGDLVFFAGGSGANVGSIAPSDTNPNVVSLLFNSTSSESRINGALAYTAQPLGTNSWSGVLFGKYVGSTQYWLNGRIYSFIGVNRTLTAGEITDLETYLASKSGVTI